MKLLTKFESKSSRAKGVAFHHKRPWVLVSLHSLTIQLWDYRMGVLIDRFEDHVGPVRCVDFHSTQPLFVSGGDDYLVKVWSLVTRKCIFTLNGHLDYVRTVFFHKELPWIISCSDDQTIRIWNWQNRQEICYITGHNHYVMLAQFHPTEDLIVSASLDETIRVWDISALRKKHSTPTSSSKTFNDQYKKHDIFNNVNAVVKFVLEGHEKGVNWASFHPTLPLIVSGGDDKQVKVWRMNDTKAWEVDTCRGHTGNVLCVLFNTYQDSIISVSDDKSIRVWDLNKRTLVKQFRRESDRFWLISLHPNINLFASCHDSGVIIFKLQKERIPFTITQDKLLYVDNKKQIFNYDFLTNKQSSPLASLKKVINNYSVISSIHFNSFENSILITHEKNDVNKFSLFTLPNNHVKTIEPSQVKQGDADFAAFISRNKFITFSAENNTINIFNLNNDVTKSIHLDSSVTNILYGGSNLIFLIKNKSVISYDILHKKELAEINIPNIKYVICSSDNQYFAFLSKHMIYIVNKNLNLVVSIHETIRIKSACWNESNVLIYSTLNHIKYCLLSGDSGVIKTLEKIMYISKIKENIVYGLNRLGELVTSKIDTTEFNFKRFLINKNYKEVLRIIKTSNLVGQNIVAFLQKKGYSEIALQFVKDPETRFELALESDNLTLALEEAKILKDNNIWEKLSNEAYNQGKIKIYEFCIQKLNLFDKLSFLYFIKGEHTKLDKMITISENRNDYSSIIQNTLYFNDVKKRFDVFMSLKFYSLAYLLAKSNELNELALEALEKGQIDENSIEMISTGKYRDFVKPTPCTLKCWPLNEVNKSIFQINSFLNLNETKNDLSDLEKQVKDVSLDEEKEENKNDSESDNDFWDLENDIEVPIGQAKKTKIIDTEISFWLHNSKTPAGFVAAGAFEQAASFLNMQLGVVNFEPLRSKFLQIYHSSKLYLTGFNNLPAMKLFVRSDDEEINKNLIRPYLPGDLFFKDDLSHGFNLFKANKLEDAIQKFREIMYTIFLSRVESDEEEKKHKEILHLCRDYILASSLELTRRKLDPNDVKRNLELAGYFTKINLKSSHKINALKVAMTQFFKHKNYTGALYFADKILDLSTSNSKSDLALKLKLSASKLVDDCVEIEFDQFSDFDICASTYTPIYKGSPCIIEHLVGAKYKPDQNGILCKITNITAVGSSTSGFRIKD